MTIKSVQDLFTLAGGSNKIAALLNLHQFSVDRWHKLGISNKWWEALIKEYKITPAELYSITQKARKEGKR